MNQTAREATAETGRKRANGVTATYEQSVQKRSAAKHSQYFLRHRDFLHLHTPLGPAFAGVLAALLDVATLALVVGKLLLLKEIGVLIALSLLVLLSDSLPAVGVLGVDDELPDW